MSDRIEECIATIMTNMLTLQAEFRAGGDRLGVMDRGQLIWSLVVLQDMATMVRIRTCHTIGHAAQAEDQKPNPPAEPVPHTPAAPALDGNAAQPVGEQSDDAIPSWTISRKKAIS